MAEKHLGCAIMFHCKVLDSRTASGGGTFSATKARNCNQSYPPPFTG